MKNIIFFITLTVLFLSCKQNFMITEDDKIEIFSKLVRMNSLFENEDEVLVYDNETGEWNPIQLPDVIDNLNRQAILENKFSALISFNTISDSFLSNLESAISKKESVNFFMLVSSHNYGDHMYRILPLKNEIGKEYCAEDGDGFLPEYMGMSELEYKEFLKSRISLVKKSKAVYKQPYEEISINYCEESERENYSVNYYFIQNKEGKWLMDDVKIELKEGY